MSTGVKLHSDGARLIHSGAVPESWHGTFPHRLESVGQGGDKGAPLTLVESARPSSWRYQGILLGDFAGRSALLKLMR